MPARPRAWPRILFIPSQSVRIPPVNGGDIRRYHHIRHLAKASDLFVVTRSHCGVSASYVKALQDMGATPVVGKVAGPPGVTLSRIANKLRAWYRPWLRTHYRGRDTAMLQELERDLGPDWVWYDHVNVLWTCGPPQTAGTIIDAYDLHYVVYKRVLETKPLLLRALYARDRAGFEATERAVLGQPDWRVLCSSEDRAKLALEPSWIIPNGYAFEGRPEMSSHTFQKRRDLLFIGLLNYQPNLDGLLWFCHEVWPEARRRSPDTILHVLGRCNRPERLASIARMPGIRVHGFVPDSSPFWEAARALIVPLRIGGGTRIKIIEAWARGCPVIATAVGAEGLNVIPDVTALVAESPEAFAAATQELLTSPEKASELAQAGYEHGLARFSWPVIEKTTRDFIRHLLASKATRAGQG